MTRPDPFTARVHEDPGLFREAVNFTAAQTGFLPRLIEKDYFCTVLLEYLAKEDAALVFKGGTCLAKVHAEFFRLSEDLDFVIPVPADAARSQRSAQASGLKEAVGALARQLPVFRVAQALTGANSSRQYIASARYDSLLSRQEETIKLEVGLREPLLSPAVNGSARTLLLDPVSGRPMLAPVSVRCISRTEAFAEKFRAALSRREAAIRDFYDIDYAVRKLGVQPHEAELVAMVKRKLAIPGNDPADVSAPRLAVLRQQLEAQLKPVLRAGDFAGFDLDRSFDIVADMAADMRRA
jgi:predicted nucleotidyltransferase component of viral defense system